MKEGLKRCSKCGILSLRSSFHKQTLSIDGLFSQCQSCVIQKQKTLYSENRGKKRKNYY